MYFMSEKLDWFKAIAAICIFAGVFIINKSAKADTEVKSSLEKESI
jgi:drug/metabolite transporter (DMT)-like permease